jgi:predicted HTH transcriptional regulator
LFGKVTYQHLSKEEQITLGTALLEETVTNARLQNIFDLHPTDIGKILFGLVEKNMLVSDSKGRWTSYKINRQYEKTPEQLYITDIEQEQPALNATDQVIYDFIRANGMITTQQVIEITGITTQQGANVALRRLIDKGLIKMVKKGLHYYYMAI